MIHKIEQQIEDQNKTPQEILAEITTINMKKINPSFKFATGITPERVTKCFEGTELPEEKYMSLHFPGNNYDWKEFSQIIKDIINNSCDDDCLKLFNGKINIFY